MRMWTLGQQLLFWMMTTRKVLTPIHHRQPLCSKFLSPLYKLKKFIQALKNIKLLFCLFLKKFQSLELMRMLLKKWRPRLLLKLKLKLKFLSLWLQRLCIKRLWRLQQLIFSQATESSLQEAKVQGRWLLCWASFLLWLQSIWLYSTSSPAFLDC